MSFSLNVPVCDGRHSRKSPPGAPRPRGGGPRCCENRTMALKIGYKASAEQFAPRELVEYAVHAERQGLDSVWISDHFQPWRHEGGHAPFSLSWLSAVGERTERG